MLLLYSKKAIPEVYKLHVSKVQVLETGKAESGVLLYGETDFGEVEGDQHWKVYNINMTQALRNYRQLSIAGAQNRRYLSTGRTLFLSYLLLFWTIDQCVLSGFTPADQKRVMNQLKSTMPCPRVESAVYISCRDMHLLVSYETKNKDEISDGLARIRTQTDNKNIKMLANVVSDLLPQFLHINHSHSRQQGEATHIINLVRPYINHILISKLEAVKSA